MEIKIIEDVEYGEWLKDLKQKVRLAHLKASIAVNTALLGIDLCQVYG